MIKIALCDDANEYKNKMKKHIMQYRKQNNIEVKIFSYDCGEQLVLSYHKRKFDVIFLDVSMANMNGFETAEQIRKIDTNIMIVFCTSYYTITNAKKGFEVEAEDFLSKPIFYNKVERILNKVYQLKLANAEEKLFLKCRDGLITLQLSDIMYVSTNNKSIVIHTIMGEIQSTQRMSQIEARLSERLFYRCHNSYLVNFDYVEAIQNDKIYIKSSVGEIKVVPVSKYKKSEFLINLAKYIGNDIN